MNEIILNNRVFNLPNDIGELPLKSFFEVMRVLENMPKDDTIDDLKFIEILEVFVGDIDDVLVSDLDVLGEEVSKLITKFEMPTQVETHFECEGRTYLTRNVNGMSELSTGEYISIKVYQDKFNNDLFSYAPYVLAILCRPCMKIYDGETNEEKWVQEPFNKKDIDNLEWRADFFLNRVPAKNIWPVLNFFLNMKG